jgi:ribose transport system permease protein
MAISDEQISEAAEQAPLDAADREDRERSPVRVIAGVLSPRRISAVYLFIATVILFGVWEPKVFLTTGNFESILDTHAYYAIAAVGLVLCFAVFQFDFAVGAEIGFGLIVAAYFSFHGMATGEVLVLTVLIGMGIGLSHAFAVLWVRIPSFIATIATSSVLLALTTIVSGGNYIEPLSPSFGKITSGKLLGLQYPVFYLLGIALVVWYVLERTPLGRRLYATGDNLEAARLSGIRTSWMIIGAYVVCGATAALAGALLASSNGAGDPTEGPQLLLPVLTACFLGSTQFKPGHHNVWGTVFAVYVLATGVQGLDEVTSVTWLSNMYNGVALLIAVGATQMQRRPTQLAAIRRFVGAVRGVRGGGASEASGAPPA